MVQLVCCVKAAEPSLIGSFRDSEEFSFEVPSIETAPEPQPGENKTYMTEDALHEEIFVCLFCNLQMMDADSIYSEPVVRAEYASTSLLKYMLQEIT